MRAALAHRWRLALAGFSYYVRDMSRFSIHGSIAAVVVFLIAAAFKGAEVLIARFSAIGRL